MSAARAGTHRAAPTGKTPSRGGLELAARQLGEIIVLGLLPLALLVYAVVHSTAITSSADAYWDFHAFWNAGHDVLHGHSPYPPPSSAVLAHEKSFVYPAPAALLMVPFALLPFMVAATLFALILIAAVPVALRILGVRDWRCYGVAFLSAPALSGITLDAVSPLLAVGLAVIWRYRDRLWPAAGGLAAVTVLKIFLWPLLLWFAFTRRPTTALAAAGLAAASTLLAWAVLGFRGLLDYPHELRLLTHLVEGKGYSLVALGLSLGSSTTVARALPWVVGGAALAVVALRCRRPGAEQWTFVVALGSALALSPIVWLHYFVLLFVPIAIGTPRLAPIWELPLAFWVVRGQSIQPPIWRPLPKKVDLALTPRIGDAPLVIYGVLVAATLLALSARSRPGETSSVRQTGEPPTT
jgi:hypothetical protein